MDSNLTGRVDAGGFCPDLNTRIFLGVSRRKEEKQKRFYASLYLIEFFQHYWNSGLLKKRSSFISVFFFLFFFLFLFFFHVYFVA